MGKLLLIVALASCAPTVRLAARRCPTTAPLLADFVATGVLLAASAHTYNDGRTGLSFALAGMGLGVALGANLSECR